MIIEGASALHLSIAYNNNDLIQDLVDAGANIFQRAIGKHLMRYHNNIITLIYVANYHLES